MNKNVKILLLAAAISLSCKNISFAQDLNPVQNENNFNKQLIAAQDSSATQTTTNTVEVSNKTTPNLVAPVVEDPKLKEKTETKKTTSSKKVDLRAVIFDPNAQLELKAQAEGREMTKLEEAEYNLNEALHCEVSSVSKISRKSLLSDYTTIKPKSGIIESMTPWFNYKGGYQNVWSGANYANNIWATDSMTTGIDGKFKDNKTVFRIMGNLGMSKAGHTFFNDVIADNYIMRYLTKTDQILIGNARSQVGYEGWLSPFALPLYTRSQVSRTYGNVRDLGIKLQGNHKLYDYSVGLASSGRNFIDWFPGEEFTGWANLKPLGLTDGRYGALTMGGGLNAGNAEGKYTVGSAYLDYEYKRWDLTAEYASADGSNGSTGFTSNQSEGYYGQLSYRVTPKLQLLARYDKFDPNKTKQNDMRTEYTVGMNYYIKGQSLKLILNYVYYTVENGTYGSQIITGMQIVL